MKGKVRDHKRVKHTYIQQLNAPPERIFPLLSPQRNRDWSMGWDPAEVYNKTGIADPDCVFISGLTDDDAIWYVTLFEEPEWQFEMAKVVPDVTSCVMQVKLSAVAYGTRARISYSHISMGEAGDRFIGMFTEAVYRQSMQEWERRINYYLEFGKPL